MGYLSLRKHAFLLLTVCFVALPSVAVSQRIELTPFAGYRWGGEFKGGNYAVGDDVLVSDLKVNDGPSYGLYLGYEAVPTVHLELVVELQPTSLERKGHDELSDSTLFDLSVYYIHGGVLYEFRQAEEVRFRPYFGFMMGVTYLSPEGSRSGETQFSGSFSAGLKMLITDLITVRLQGRFSSTYIGDGEKFFCDENNNCQTYGATTYLTQGDVLLGVTFGF
jgi:hypothetical protein